MGHLKALQRIASDRGVFTFNLGTGKGYSVLDMVRAFEAASGKIIPYQVAPRRPGDIAECWADPTTAESELGWRAERDLQCMMRDSWRWQSQKSERLPRCARLILRTLADTFSAGALGPFS